MESRSVMVGKINNDKTIYSDYYEREKFSYKQQQQRRQQQEKEVQEKERLERERQQKIKSDFRRKNQEAEEEYQALLMKYNGSITPTTSKTSTIPIDSVERAKKKNNNNVSKKKYYRRASDASASTVATTATTTAATTTSNTTSSVAKIKRNGKLGLSRRISLVEFDNESNFQIHDIGFRSVLENKQRWYKAKDYTMFIEDAFDTVSKAYIEKSTVRQQQQQHSNQSNLLLNPDIYCLRGLEAYSPDYVETRTTFVRDILFEQNKYRSLDLDYTVRLSALSLFRSKKDVKIARNFGIQDQTEANQIYRRKSNQIKKDQNQSRSNNNHNIAKVAATRSKIVARTDNQISSIFREKKNTGATAKISRIDENSDTIENTSIPTNVATDISSFYTNTDDDSIINKVVQFDHQSSDDKDYNYQKHRNHLVTLDCSSSKSSLSSIAESTKKVPPLHNGSTIKRMTVPKKQLIKSPTDAIEGNKGIKKHNTHFQRDEENESVFPNANGANYFDQFELSNGYATYTW